jgi:hypothetical protein
VGLRVFSVVLRVILFLLHRVTQSIHREPQRSLSFFDQVERVSDNHIVCNIVQLQFNHPHPLHEDVSKDDLFLITDFVVFRVFFADLCATISYK